MASDENLRSSKFSFEKYSVIWKIFLDELGSDTISPSNTSNDYLQNAVEHLPLLTNRFVKSTALGTRRVQNYVEKTVPTYSDPMFKAHFRMSRTSFEELLVLIGPHIHNIRNISLERRTLACIWYVGNTETFRSVADRFGISKGNLHYYIAKFNAVFRDHDILQQLISWPRNEQQYNSIAEDFSRRAGFPSVVEALDGTYIPISGPSNYRDSYICRKVYPAMHLQAVCDSDLKFLDVFSAYPGSVHDARVFKNSPLYQALQELPPKFHLLGDSAYPLTTFLLTPFRDNGHLSTEQKCYNSAHSSTRVDIERCFGLLKGKFRKLKFLDMHKVEEIPSMIIACCALHNFIIMHEKDYEPDIEVEIEQIGENLLHDFDNDEGESVSGQCKRQEIMHLLA